MEKTINRGGEEVAGSTSPLTKGNEEERVLEEDRLVVGQTDKRTDS